MSHPLELRDVLAELQAFRRVRSFREIETCVRALFAKAYNVSADKWPGAETIEEHRHNVRYWIPLRVCADIQSLVRGEEFPTHHAELIRRLLQNVSGTISGDHSGELDPWAAAVAGRLFDDFQQLALQRSAAWESPAPGEVQTQAAVVALQFKEFLNKAAAAQLDVAEKTLCARIGISRSSLRSVKLGEGGSRVTKAVAKFLAAKISLPRKISPS